MYISPNQHGMELQNRIPHPYDAHRRPITLLFSHLNFIRHSNTTLPPSPHSTILPLMRYYDPPPNLFKTAGPFISGAIYNLRIFLYARYCNFYCISKMSYMKLHYRKFLNNFLIHFISC